ncbi:MAG: hypothetical protein ACTSO6_12955 [Promethearchaeota archaeon]
MMKKKYLIIVTLIFQFFFCGLLVVALDPTIASSSTYDYYDLKLSSVDFSNATVVSDGFNSSYWNDAGSYNPAIAVDSDKVHLVWEDYTDGVWGADAEIMYATYNSSTGWSNITIISDGYNGSYWNDGESYKPKIAVDSSNAVHVVWHDYTAGVWGTDIEIMYATYTTATGWSNVTVISDGYNGVYWNDDFSFDPAIAVDSSDKVHVVWEDFTDGAWGTDIEIMYATYTTSTGWSNVTIISDGYDGSYWNDAGSYNPAIAIDRSDKVHVVWDDYTDGVWGVDAEIMYATYTTATGWSNVTIISDGLNNIYWNDGLSTNPAIAVDSSNDVHVVWHDATYGVWGTDAEIMYAHFTSDFGWLLPRIISDGYNGSYWNDGHSYNPKIAVDRSNAVHVVWEDRTDGVWGTDDEIMYVNFTKTNSWSNITVLSEGYNGVYWNNGHSRDATIAISTNQVHVVWEDGTDGVWGTDYEIMYTNFAIPVPPVVSGPGGIPFGNFYLLFIAVSIIGLVAYKKRKL